MYKIPATTLFLGKNIVFVPECHSTNDLALQLCQKSNTPEGTIIITSHQTAGRGQRGNTWEAAPNLNLTCSLIIKPNTLRITDQFYLNIFTSLGIMDCITELMPEKIHIKWPNDVVAGNKKICGILIENQIQGNQFVNTVIGIGLNVNQKQFAISTASSLSVLAEKEFELPALLEKLLHKLEVRYLQLREGKLTMLRSDYLKNLYGINEMRKFTSAGETFNGIIKGINDEGKLQVETASEVKSFALKEISYGYADVSS